MCRFRQLGALFRSFSLRRRFYGRTGQGPPDHIEAQQHERNTQQLPHVKQHALFERLLILLDELDEETGQKDPDQTDAKSSPGRRMPALRR